MYRGKIFVFFIIFLIFHGCLLADGQHRTFEEAKKAREHLVKKYLKRIVKENGSIRLIGGRDEYEGNVEIYHDGKWGAVCDDEWDKNEAEVVCKQLGFIGVKKVTHSSAFGQTKRKYWMDNIFCDGKEKELSDCRFDGWGHNDCEITEAAGVICKKSNDVLIKTKQHVVQLKKSKHKIHKKDKFEIRLLGGRMKNEGRVEIRFGDGAWGTICGDGWSLLEGNVVCRSLGLGYANDAIQTDFFNDANHTTKLLLSGTQCYGNETTLTDCLHHEVTSNVFCHGPKNHVAVVSCVKNMADLVFNHLELEQTAHLEDKPLYFLQCAMEENCVATRAYEIQKENPSWHLETRRLLKFTASVINAGTADFRPPIPKEQWEWHTCHMHFHSMEVFATFDIINENGEKVAEGHKASFCLEDNQCMPGVKPKYACADFGDQGISVNCTDIYKYNIDCQWVDITELDIGMYTLKISVNPEFKVPEMSYDNNAAVCKFMYTQSYARVYDCIIQRP